MKSETIILKLSDELIGLLKLPQVYTPQIVNYFQLAYGAGYDAGRCLIGRMKSRSVAQCTMNGRKIAIFPSTAAAGRHINRDRASITRVCQGKQKQCGGYKFKYIK